MHSQQNIKLAHFYTWYSVYNAFCRISIMLNQEMRKAFVNIYMFWYLSIIIRELFIC